MKRAPLFHYFLDGSRMVYKVDDIQYDSKVKRQHILFFRYQK